MKLTGSNSTQPQTKILDILLCAYCWGPGAPQLAVGILGRSLCQHLCPGTCPVVGQGTDASGCLCLCMASTHLQNLCPTHQPWGGGGGGGRTSWLQQWKTRKKNHTKTMCGLLFGVALLQQCWLQSNTPSIYVATSLWTCSGYLCL